MRAVASAAGRSTLMLFRRHRQRRQLNAIGPVQIADGAALRAERLEDRTLLSAVVPLTDDTASADADPGWTHSADDTGMNSIRELVSGFLSGHDVQWQPLKLESGFVLMTGVIHTDGQPELVLAFRIIPDPSSSSGELPAEGTGTGGVIFELQITSTLTEGRSVTLEPDFDLTDLAQRLSESGQAAVPGFDNSFDFKGSLYPADPGTSSEPLLSQEGGGTLELTIAADELSPVVIERAIPSSRSEIMAAAGTVAEPEDVVDDIPDLTAPAAPLPVALQEAVFSPVGDESGLSIALVEFTESSRSWFFAVSFVEEPGSIAAGMDAVAVLEQGTEALLEQMTVSAVSEAAFRPFEPVLGLAGTMLVMVRSTARTLALALRGELELEAAPMAAFVEPVLSSPAVGNPARRLELRAAEDFEPAPVSQTAPANRAFEIRDIGPMPDPPVEPLEAALTLLTLPRHGVLERVPGSSSAFRYRPDPGFSGVDEFRFRQASPGSSSREGQVILEVPVDSPETGPAVALDPAAGDDVLAHAFNDFEDWFRPVE